MEPVLVLHVCSREEAGAILSSPRQRADVSFLISIGEAHDTPPAGYNHIRDRLRLFFADATDETGPTERDVQSLVDIARRIGNRAGRVVIHCQAGISRSTAAAIIVQTTILGAGKEDEAVAGVFQQRPIARPNRRMIELADTLLEREGRLIAAVRARMDT